MTGVMRGASRRFEAVLGGRAVMWLRFWVLATCVGQAYVSASRYSTVILVGSNGTLPEKGSTVTWSVIHPSFRVMILVHTFGSSKVYYGDFHKHRIVLNTSTGSLKLKNADMADSGIYESLVAYPGLGAKKTYHHTILKIQEILDVPLIVQTRLDFKSAIRLQCVVQRGEADTILWFKGGKPLYHYPVYKMSANNRTVTFNSVHVTDCEVYTCVIRNKINQNQQSHVLLINGLLLLHQYSLLTSVLALVSTSTTFAASVFIAFFALDTYRVYRRHVQLTAVFVFLQLLSFITLLTAALFCLIDPNFSVSYKAIEGFVFFLVLGMILYIVLIYLRPENPLKRSFLLKKYQRNIFLLHGVFAIFFSIVPIYRGQNILKDCGQPMKHFLGSISFAVAIYLFTIGVAFLIFVKYMKSWTKVRRSSRLSSR
ncbi:uncharacterized protein [Narcine bancroftii]|uniref:uncharacterized protein isoform X2 n=1 Tax=Narcine bancroftii TaxID=1343680 RepID=UPI003831FD59